MIYTPFIVSGTTYNSFGNVQSNVEIKFESSISAKFVYSDSKGHYLIDLAEIGYSDGDNISYEAFDEFYNDTYKGSFILSGSNKTLNINLSVRDDSNIGAIPNKGSIIFSPGGKSVSSANPLYVTNTNNPDIDLINNPEHSWVITRSDGQPDSETVTFANGDIYYRTFTYTSNILTARSKWQKL